MKLSNYYPTFRQVLIKEITIEKTVKGIFLPSTQLDDKIYQVVKVGKDCIEVKPGDVVKITQGIRTDAVDLTVDETLIRYVQVMEQQIIGYERES